MSTVTKIKSFFYKESYDFDRPDITFNNFHPHVRFFYAAYGIFFNNSKSKIRLLFPILWSSYAMCTMGLCLMFVYHGIDVKDYSFATESFCYFVLNTMVPVIYGAMCLCSESLRHILQLFEDDFKFFCQLGPDFRRQFVKGQLLIWQLCWTWLIFLTFIIGAFTMSMVLALVYQSLFGVQDENTVRPLVFPIWLPHDDPYRTPNYEVFLVLEIGCIVCVYIPFSIYSYLLFHFLLHATIVIDMIVISFSKIFDGLDENVTLLPKDEPQLMYTQQVLNARMGQIVTWHSSVFNYVRLVQEVFGIPLKYQVLFSSLAICLMMYQVADKLEHGQIDYLFCILSVATLLQLWIPCYLGTMIRNKAFSLGDTCFDCGWQSTRLGKLLRQDMILFILRAQQPVTIKFTFLPDLQLETFSSILSSSYSYFNMLRQTTH